MIDFDRRGWLVRKVIGQKHQSYRIPGYVLPRRWSFPYGVAVIADSHSDALEAVESMLRARQRLMECA